MEKLLNRLVPALQQGQATESIDLAREWLATAEPGEPTALIWSCPERTRPLLRALLRDVLVGYPNTLLGCPVLIHATPDDEVDRPIPQQLWLPSPHSNAEKPCTGLQFEGWLASDADLPVNLMPPPLKPAVPVPWRTSTAAVALFRHDHMACIEEDIDVPLEWWGDLFRSTPGQVRLSGRVLLPYPDALDAARVMQAAARGETSTGSGAFLSDGSWASESGLVFANACARDCAD